MILSKQDVFDLLELCKEFHGSSRMKDVPLDLETCIKTIRNYINSPKAFTRFYRKDDKIIGMFIGALVPLFFSKESQAQDLVFMVSKEHRGGLWFSRTLKEFEQWAQEQGAIKVVLYHDTGIDTEKAVPLLTTLEYEQTGYCFSKDIKCVE